MAAGSAIRVEGLRVKALLIVAHPGHELRIFHWLELARPIVSILTDGSGGDKASRTGYSEATLAAAGAVPGPVFGTMPDQAWYRAILERDVALFRQVVEAIVAPAAGEAACTVVSDAADGYNPVHDLTSAVGRAVAVRLEAAGVKVRRMASAAVPGVKGDVAERLDLDEVACARKLAAVRAYQPLAEEARRILAADPASLAHETFVEDDFDWPEDFRPQWETFGADRVDAGRYRTLITYRDHVRPIARALLDGR